LRVSCIANKFGDGVISVGAVGARHIRHHAEIQSVIGYALKVEGLFHLHHETRGVFYGVTLGESIGVVWRASGTHQKGIKRKSSVYVQIAKVGVAFRVGRDVARFC